MGNSHATIPGEEPDPSCVQNQTSQALDYRGCTRPSVRLPGWNIHTMVEIPAFVIGGVEDYLHALFLLSKNQPLKKEDCRRSQEAARNG